MAITDVLNLTPQLVAEQNPELHQMRKIAFGEDYISDIEQGTGTAQYYTGWGNVPTIDWTQQDAETTVPVETEVAPNVNIGGGGGGGTGCRDGGGDVNSSTTALCACIWFMVKSYHSY